MGILDDLLLKVRSLDNDLTSGGLVRSVVVRHPVEIITEQRRQLLEGKRPDGNDIRPYYSEDLKPGGYFKSRETASAYAAWKGTISTPHAANRNPDAPNLYINGRFHSELDVEFGDRSVGIVGLTPYARGIMDKYGNDTFGLSPQRWNAIFIDYGAYDEMMREIRSRLFS